MKKHPLRGPTSAAVPFILFFLFTLVTGFIPSGASASTSQVQDLMGRANARQSLAQLRMPFIANQGQQSPDVAFSANTPWGAAFVSRTGEIAYLVAAKDETVRTRFVKEKLIGAAPAMVHGDQRLPTAISFLRGADPAQWQRGVPAYQQVSLGKVYPGIEIKLQASASNIEKLFFIDPHANPALIKVRPANVTGLKLTRDGELELKTPKGPVIFTKPVAYQEQDGGRVYVDVAYRVAGNDYGFKLGAYDAAKPLVIDPILASASLGGSSNDRLTGMAIDAAGSVFVSGITYSVDLYATPGVFDPTFSAPYAGTDGFVAKLSADLTTVLALTYLGGQGSANAIALDSAGAVFVTGSTNASNFPTASNGYQRVSGGKNEGFILKLSADLTALLGGTFLGGSGNDVLGALLIDAYDNVYVGGTTSSANFPITTGAMDTTWGGGKKYVSRFYNYSWGDGFVAKLNNGLSALLASTFIGGSKGDETVASLALDSLGNVLVMGLTGSTDFPTTTGAYDRTYNGGSNLLNGMPWGDVFISKLNGNLSQMIASTYLGGNARDYGSGLAVDAQNNVYVSGETYSNDFPVTPGVLDSTGPTNTTYTEGFISKFSPDLTALSASTFLGGSYSDSVSGLAIDSAGNVHAVGYTSSFDFPAMAGVFQGDADSFAARMNNQLTSLFESELLGVSGSDGFGLIAFGQGGAVYAAGGTSYYVGLTLVTNTRIVKLGAVDLSIGLVDTPDPIASGSSLTYTLSIANGGVITATGVTVTQTLPDHINFVSATSAQGACSYTPGTGGMAGTVTCTLGTLAGGASAMVSVVVIPTDSGAYGSTAVVSSVEGDSNLANNSAAALTTVGSVPGTADLSIAVTDSPDPVGIATPLTYAVTVTNNSTNAATGITVTDTLPAGVSFLSAVSSQGVCGESAGIVTCNLGALGGNTAATASIVVQASAAGSVNNSVTVSAAETDPNLANNTASATTSVVVLADLAVTQTATPNPASVGTDLIFNIAVSNNGPSSATAVSMADSLPATVTFVSATPTQGSCAQAGGAVNCALGSLASGASASVAVVVTPTTAGVTLTNIASVSSAETDSNASNNAVTASVLVSGAASTTADVGIEFLTDSPDPATVGQPLNYVARIFQYWSGAAVNVVVEDVLPAGVSFVGAYFDGAPCAFNTGVVRCEGSVSISPSYVQIKVIPNVSGTIVNTVTVSGALTDPNLANNSLSASTSVVADTTPADVRVALSGPVNGNVGVAMTYTATVTNTGPGNATSAKLTDTLQSGMTLSSATASQGSCGLAAGVLTCDLGTMAVGAVATVTIVVVPTGDGGFTHTVKASSAKSDPDTTNNTASLDTEVR